MTKEKLTDELAKELADAFPGVVFNFSQYINDNVEEALSGVKGENSVKILGPDLETNEKNGEAIVELMGRVPGVRDLGMGHTLGQPSVKIIPDRAACARYGLNTGDVEAVVSAAIGGQAITQVWEGEKHVRADRPLAGTVPAVARSDPRDYRRHARRGATSRSARSPRCRRWKGPR